MTMRSGKKKWAVLLCLISIMLLCLGLAACGTKTYKVTLDYNAEQGEVTLSPEAENNEYEEGTEITVTVKPNNGFELDTLTLSTEDRAATPNNEGKFVFKVQEDTTVRVTFKATTPGPVEDKFSITKNSPENGTIDVSPAADAEGKYAKDTEITVTLKPAQGYEVDTFTVGGVDKKADLQNNVYKFNITANTAINATFKSSEPVVEKYTLTKNSPENGTIDVSPAADEEGKYAKNADITVTLTPAQGYEVDTFTVGGVDKKADLQDNVYTFKITENTAINATFKAQQFTVTVNYEAEQGTIELTPDSTEGKYAYGAQVEVSVAPAAGYEVDTFTVSTDESASLDGEGKYTLTVTANTTITASFKSKIIHAIGIEDVPTSLELEYGEFNPTQGTRQLQPRLVPANSTDKLTYKIVPESVASVSEDGLLTALKVGEAVLTVSAGDQQVICSVSVKQHEHVLSYAYKDDSLHTASCSGCSYTKDEEHQTKLVSDGELGHHAICEQEGCSYKTETVAHSELVVTATSSPTYHSLKCLDDCGYSIDEAHKMEVASSSTQHWIECSVCHKITHQEDHTLKYEVTEDGQKHIAYCDSKISGTVFTCTYRSEAEDHQALEGVFTKSDDATSHYSKCKDCEALYNPVAHSGSGFTVKDGDAEHHYHLCDGCKQAYGEAINHSGSGFTVKEDDAEHHYHLCDDCKQAYGEAIAHGGTAHVLKAGDDTHHYTKCTDCETLYDAQEHSGDGFTLKDGDADHHYRLCDDCQQAYGEAINHSGTVHVMKPGDDDHHYTKCAGCETLFDPQEHLLSYTDKDDSVHSVACSLCEKTFPDEPHEIVGAACKCGHQVGSHTVVVDEYGYTDGSCSCGKENLLFTTDGNGTITEFSAEAQYTKIKLPTKIGEEQINSFSNAVFKNNVNITDIIVPDGINLPSSSAFSGCTSLKHAVLLEAYSKESKGAVTVSIPALTFGGCTQLEWIVLPSKITELNVNIFGSTPAVSKIKIYFMGTESAWTSMVTALKDPTSGKTNAKTVLTSAQSSIRFLEHESADKCWHWKTLNVLPEDGKAAVD